MSTTKTGATKVRRLIDATVEADLSGGLNWWQTNTPERLAEALESLVKEFHEHIRDHRSLDFIRLTVNRVVQEQCSLCEAEWETMRDDETGATHCANCGGLVA